jgi:hypothetical protein
MLTKSCIIRILHYFVKFSITLLLSISLLIKIPIIKLRLRVLEHEAIVRPVLSRETILIVEVPETILLILALHLMYLSPQVSDLILIFVL